MRSEGLISVAPREKQADLLWNPGKAQKLKMLVAEEDELTQGTCKRRSV